STQSGGPNWLQLDRQGQTLQTGDAGFNIFTNPSSLAPGIYTGTVTATSTSTADSVQIAVTLTVNSNSTLSVSPANPAPFLYQVNGTVPSPQNLTLTSSSGSLTYSVQQAGIPSWLVVNPLSGAVGTSNPATISLSVVPQNLPAGTYTTNVQINASNNTAVPPI